MNDAPPSPLELGKRVDPRGAADLAATLRPALVDAEIVLGIHRAAPPSLTATYTVVTNARVLHVATHEGVVLRREHRLVDIEKVSANRVGMNGQVLLLKQDGSRARIDVAAVIGAAEEAARLAELIQRASSHPDHRRATETLPTITGVTRPNRPTTQVPTRRATMEPVVTLGPATTLVGDPVTGPTLAAIHGQSATGEEPWLVISTTGEGVLVAFDDRLVIIEAEDVTSFSAGALDADTAVFRFVDITGIAYNAGVVDGVLEVLTPSWSGATNDRFWHDTGFDADLGEPYVLDNSFPLSREAYALAGPHLDELRRRIADAQGADAPDRRSTVE